MPYKQLRFYCYQDRPGRTIHIKTLEGYRGAMVLYYLLQTDGPIAFCNSYFRYYDDNSKLTQNCADSFGNANAWGSGWRDDEIYLGFLYKSYRYDYTIAVIDEITNEIHSECDSHRGGYGDENYGNWKIFAR